MLQRAVIGFAFLLAAAHGYLALGYMVFGHWSAALEHFGWWAVCSLGIAGLFEYWPEA